MTYARVTVASFIAACLLVAAPAHATLVTYDFQAEIDFDGSGFFSGKSVGDTISGTFTFDLAGSVASTGAENVIYTGAFGISVEGTVFGGTPFLNVFSEPGLDGLNLNLFPSGIQPTINLRSSSDIFPNPPPIPVSLPSLGVFDILAQLALFDPSLGTSLATFTQITQQGASVPAPGALTLLGFGLLGLGLRRRGQ